MNTLSDSQKSNRAAFSFSAAILPFAGVIFFLAAWECIHLAGFTNRWLVVPPSRLPSTFLRLWQSGDLSLHLNATLGRLAIAVFWGTGSGLVIGLASGSLRGVGLVAEPLLNGLFAMPKIALFPLSLALLGVGEFSRSLPAVLSAFSVMALHSMDAARSVPRPMAVLARSFGARGWSLARTVYIPACLPRIFDGFRMSLGLALVMVISAEMLGAPDGIGILIWTAGQSMAMDRLYAGLVLCAFLGLAATWLVRKIQVKLIPWSQQ